MNAQSIQKIPDALLLFFYVFFSNCMTTLYFDESPKTLHLFYRNFVV